MAEFAGQTHMIFALPRYQEYPDCLLLHNTNNLEQELETHYDLVQNDGELEDSGPEEGPMLYFWDLHQAWEHRGTAHPFWTAVLSSWRRASAHYRIYQVSK